VLGLRRSHVAGRSHAELEDWLAEVGVKAVVHERVIRYAPEATYRDLFVAQYDGVAEVRLAFGRADVVSAGIVVEVEPFATWRSGIRQALAYAAMTPWRHLPKLEPAVAIYGDLVGDTAIDLYLRTRDYLRLYLFNEGTWHHVTSRAVARGRWRASQ